MDKARRDVLETILAESEGLLRLAVADQQSTLVSLLRDVVRAAKADLDGDGSVVSEGVRLRQALSPRRAAPK